MSRRSAAIGLIGATVIALVLWMLVRGDAPQVHDDREGMLSANSGSGGVGLAPPPGASPWFGSFGSFVLCVTKPGAQAHLRRVRYDADIEPLSVSFLLRTVPPAASNDDDRERTPFISSKGRWPNLNVGPLAGDVKPFGGVIDQPCSHAAREVDGFTELVVQLRSTRAGARIRRMYVDYTVDGKPRTLRIRWQLVMCGTRTRDVCEPER